MINMQFIAATVLIFCGIISKNEGQVIFSNCPRGWVSDSSNCYKFVDNDPLIFEEADAACWKDGANLLSINSQQEHAFISSWLQDNDILPPSVWLTSGYYARDVVLWEDHIIHDGDRQWAIDVHRYTEGRIAYKFGGTLYKFYGWTVVSASIPLNYICEILQSESVQIDMQQRGIDYGYGIIDPKNIPRGPYLREQPDNIIVVKGELSVYLECTSDGNPYPVFTWWRRKEGDDVEVTSEMDTRYTLSGGRFTIEDPKDKDIAYYRCKATNDYGTVLSHFSQIQFGFLGEFPPVEPTDYRAKAFRGIRVDCNTPSYYPDVRYEWSKFGTAAWLFPGGSYTFVSQAGYMYFSEVQPTDQKEYFCFVTLATPKNYRMNTKQPPMVINKGIWLMVIEQTDATWFGPEIKTHAFPSPALWGHDIRLECIAYGTLPVSYKWKRKDGRPFVKGTKIIDRNRVLIVPDAPLSAEGEYVCSVSCRNGVGSKTITVVMEARPYFPHGIGDMFVDPAQAVKWRCKAVARPLATYVWYKNGEVLQSIPGEMEVKGTLLHIYSVDQEKHEGMYQCSASNIHGTTFSTGRLKVLSFVPNFDKHPLPESTLAPYGGDITIPCMVEAAPLPQVAWLKNGADLNLIPGELNGRIGMTVAFGLVLTQIDYSDAGSYVCKASNINGEASNRTVVTVVAGISITTAPSPTTAKINTTAFLYCHAAYNYIYDVTYQWSFNGHIIDFNLNPEFILGQQIGVYGLYVTQAQFEHTGTYECTALTTLHSDTRSAILTVTGPPGPPAGVYVDVLSITPESVRLVWTIGVETGHGEAITGYDIEAETHYRPGVWKSIMTDIQEHITVQEAIDHAKRTDQRVIVVQGLIPHTGYRFRVRAINLYGRGEEASQPSVTIQTPETSPVTAPRHVSGGGGKVGTLVITWDPLDIAEHSGPGLGYNVYWKLHEEKQRGWNKAQVLDADGKRYYEDIAEKIERMMFTKTIGPDNFYLQYDVKIGTYNDHGDGPNSTASIIWSAEGMPIARPEMEYNPAHNSTSVWCRWKKVPDNRETMKGRVRGYTVQYFKRKYNFNPFQGHDPDFMKQKEVYGTKNYVLLVGLYPHAEYFARVQVWNSAGRGPKGEWRRSETRFKAPHEWPTHVSVHPHSEHSVKVHWRGILTRAGEEMLEGYIVRVWKIQDDIRTANDTKTGKETEAIIENLQKQTVYVLRVLGYSWGGEGAKGEAVYFTVLGGNLPFDPATTQICFQDEHHSTCGSRQSLPISVTLMLTFNSAVQLLWNMII